jgi:hypothetical protein
MRFKEWNVFARSNTGIVGSNPIRGMEVCFCSVFLRSVFLQLATACPPSKESHRLCVRLRHWKKRSGLKLGCRVIVIVVVVVVLVVIQPTWKSKSHKFPIIRLSLDSCFFLPIRSKKFFSVSYFQATWIMILYLGKSRSCKSIQHSR